MEKSLEKIYDEQFYNEQVEGSVRSAMIVLEILYKIYQPRSVVEFGCGLGGWLASAESLGALILKGYDGNWVDTKKLKSKQIDFSAVDLEQDISVLGKYDLAISLEVAEHLTQERAKTFIKNICSVSDVVMFGAAIPYQGGANHINEQWQSYWIDLFEDEGYLCHDIFRKQIWDNAAVDCCYRQNTFLFIKKNNEINMNEQLKNLELSMHNLVHPEFYLCKIAQIKSCDNLLVKPTLKFFLKVIRRFVKNKLRNLVKMT